MADSCSSMATRGSRSRRSDLHSGDVLAYIWIDLGGVERLNTRANSYCRNSGGSSGPRPAQNGQAGQGGALVISAFFMGAANNPVGHDNRLGSGFRDECQHFFRHPDVVADVGLVLREPASKVGRLGVVGGWARCPP